jgi:hypothetical protein
MPVRSEVEIRTGRPEFDGLYPLVRGFLISDRLDLVIDGERIRGYRTPDARSVWIRDHSDMMRAFRYFEPDLASAVQHFADTQASNGRVFDYVTTFPEKLPCERENWTKYVRVPVEADVEYRFVKAAYLAWQASGDDAWARRLLPSLERAMAYVRGHRWYWDEGTGLVKRPYTIDTWDFAYTAGRHEWLQFQITDDTFWGVMHGDNSGYYEAFRLLARLHRRLGDPARAAHWDVEAETLRANLNRTCWNGRFYTHFVKLTPVVIDGVDESAQLSLSNPMDVNRGVADAWQASSIIEEYRRRGARGGAFAEWFSIDPPFPDGVFGDERLVRGAYCNGGIMPLVGGELARAAFSHGFESYGADILARYHRLVSARGESYLWYFPDGTPSTVETSTSPDALPTDGWGSSAMVWALVEGLAGIVDVGCAFDDVHISPRWLAAGLDEAEARAGYAASDRGVGYAFRQRASGIELEFAGDARQVAWHVLLPPGARIHRAWAHGRDIEVRHVEVGASRYADFETTVDGGSKVTLAFD